MGDKKIAETPLMKQYFEVKAQNPDALLLFRVGDFYETFGDDAVTASKVLGIVLTKRANGAAAHVDLAGFPHHALNTYLPKLVRSGYKVAVCDQLEDPKLTKNIVKRGITELVTPGVVYNEQLLSNKENNYLASIHFSKETTGIAFLDISTGTFRIAQGSRQYIDVLLSGFAPKELLVCKSDRKKAEERFGNSIYISTIDEWAFMGEAAMSKLKEHFGAAALKGFGVSQMPVALTAAGAALAYLELTHHTGLSHICSISRIDEGEFVWMDRFTVRNLEIFRSAYENEGGISLLDVMDHTCCPMGGRTLRSWLATPLKDITKINDRLAIVEYFTSESLTREDLRHLISEIGDMERIISRAAAGRINPREMLQLQRGLRQIKPISELCRYSGVPQLLSLADKLEPCDDLLETLQRTLLPDAASQIGKGDIIASGVNEELDNLREIAHNSKKYLNDMLEGEMQRTGISSLKIGFNNVFGYYLEVRNTHKDKVPEEWIRKQTLVNAERYITPQLKEYEEKILGAEDRIYLLEQQIFQNLVMKTGAKVPDIRRDAELIGALDTLAGFADLAEKNGYCKPEVNDSDRIEITKGRHPVIETRMPAGEEYIANDISINNSDQQIIILTGPNMSGKSALLRQTALIVLMAQVGSFVPAQSASIGYTDKIFTRVGASDNISKGESTFMVEMLETAAILHNISSRSLVLLDEIGRGTSTYDGMSIAWAIVEFLHEHMERAKTLFATHYHELNELENLFPRVHNYHISTKEVNGKIIFLRKLTPGGVAHSFGIHVAKIAGMPSKVVYIAEKKLRELEEMRENILPQEQTDTTQESPSGISGNTDNAPQALSGKNGRRRSRESAMQLSLFQLDDPLLAEIRKDLEETDINKLSPLDAFDKLRQLKEKLVKE